MKLYVDVMDATLVEVSPDGRVRYAPAVGAPNVDEGWSTPTLQERRAILYAAQSEMAALAELLEILEASSAQGP